MSAPPPICCFYSYKGGVGRTLCLLGVALEAAVRGLKVLVVDGDVDAPGLSWIPSLAVDSAEPSGLLECLLEIAEWGTVGDLGIRSVDLGGAGGSLAFLPAVADPAHLPGLLQRWQQVESSADATQLRDCYGVLRTMLLGQKTRGEVEHFDLILVDLRTSLSPLSLSMVDHVGDLVVLVSALNEQNLQGALRLQRTIFGLPRRPHLLMVASPIPLGEEELLQQRRTRWAQLLGGPPDVEVEYSPILALEDDLLALYRRLPQAEWQRKHRKLLDLMLARLGRENGPALWGALEAALRPPWAGPESTAHVFQLLGRLTRVMGGELPQRMTRLLLAVSGGMHVSWDEALVEMLNRLSPALDEPLWALLQRNLPTQFGWDLNRAPPRVEAVLERLAARQDFPWAAESGRQLVRLALLRAVQEGGDSPERARRHLAACWSLLSPGERARAQAQLAQVSGDEDDLVRARRACEGLLSHGLKDAQRWGAMLDAWVHLARAEGSAGAWERVVQEAESGGHLDPSLALLRRAEALGHLGQREAARVDLERAQELSLDHGLMAEIAARSPYLDHLKTWGGQ